MFQQSARMLAVPVDAETRTQRRLELKGCSAVKPHKHRTWNMQRRWGDKSLGKKEAARGEYEEIRPDTNKHDRAMRGLKAAAVRCR